MNLGIIEFREDFKKQIEKWQNGSIHGVDKSAFLDEIKKWGAELDRIIQLKVKLITEDFNALQLKGDYKKTVPKSFEDLELLLRAQKTFTDLMMDDQLESILKKVQLYYVHSIIPLFNIIAMLENDYSSLLSQNINENGRLIHELDLIISKLKETKQKLKRKVFIFHKTEKITDLSKKINNLELKRKITQLSLYHDKLSLYYFNHERPPELREIKAKTDKLKMQLKALEESTHAYH